MKRLEGIGDKDFCRRLNVIDRHGYVTYAGLMMFGKAPEIFEYIPTFCVDYVEIPGSSIERSNVRFADLCEQQGISVSEAVRRMVEHAVALKTVNPDDNIWDSIGKGQLPARFKNRFAMLAELTKDLPEKDYEGEEPWHIRPENK